MRSFSFALFAFFASACGGDKAVVDAAVDTAVPVDLAVDASPDAAPFGEPLFGTPNEKTGLSSEQCRPMCTNCSDGTFESPTFDEARLDALRAWTLVDAPALLASDPYETEPPVVSPSSVCAVVVEDAEARTYNVRTFESREAAENEGAIVTHYGVCGLCSSLEDLAVYAGTPDLTDPVRACGLRASSSHASLRACLEELGFTSPCADIWAYNTTHTRNACLSVCVRLLSAPYHNADGSLNACLQCDEDMSGDVFKAVAGRTRRNTGVASSMCRPCSEVHRIGHVYE